MPLHRAAKPNMVSLGIDVSTRLGAVVVTEDRGRVRPLAMHEFTGAAVLEGAAALPGSVNAIRRARSIAEQVVQVALRHEPEVIVVEGYGFASSNGLSTCVEVGTSVLMTLWKHSFEWTLCEPTRLKKFILGVGKGKKDQHRLGVYKRWAFEHDSDNVVDAFALACVGLALKDRLADVLTPQQEVVQAIRAQMDKHGG